MGYYQAHVFFCTNKKEEGKKCCAGQEQALQAADKLKQYLIAQSMHGPGKIRVSTTGCLGRCASGPCVVVYPEGKWLTYTSPEDIDQLGKILINGALEDYSCEIQSD